MAIGKIQVTPQELTNAALKVSELAAKYKEDYTSLYATIKSIAELGIWAGKDHDAYVAQIEQFKNDFEAMQKEMEHYASFLRKAADAYSGTQNNVTESVSKKLCTGV